MNPGQKKLIILMTGLISIILILLVVRVFSPRKNIEPSPVPSIEPSVSPFAEPSPNRPREDVIFEKGSLKKDFERISSPKPLEQKDLEIRGKLIDSLGGNSGVLRQNNQYKIEYLKSGDSFMIEIFSKNTAVTKKSAFSWFVDQGLSNEGVCNLPIVFYLSPEVAQSFEQSKTTFNPVPEECGK